MILSEYCTTYNLKRHEILKEKLMQTYVDHLKCNLGIFLIQYTKKLLSADSNFGLVCNATYIILCIQPSDLSLPEDSACNSSQLVQKPKFIRNTTKRETCWVKSRKYRRPYTGILITNPQTTKSIHFNNENRANHGGWY